MWSTVESKFESRIVGNVAVVSCSGPIKFGLHATELHVRIKQLVADGLAVVLDLAEVPAIDSSGIGMLFAIYTSTLNSQVKFAVAGMSPHVQEVLTMTKALTLIPAYTNAEEALSAIA